MTRGANLLSCQKRVTPAKLHSEEGIKQLAEAVRYGLRTKYYTIAMGMFRYDGWDTEAAFADMNIMSRHNMPEAWLFDQGQACVFRVGDQLHCLPVVYHDGINIYGYPDEWSPQPIGWDTNAADAAISRLTGLSLNYENSVIIRNDRFATADRVYIDAKIEQLIDSDLTFNQLQLLAKSPFMFNTTPEHVLTCKNIFLQIAENKPVVYKSQTADAQVEAIQMSKDIDISLFELVDRLDCDILEYLGFPCIPVTKRAQQSVSEVQSNDDKIMVRRQARLFYRQQAVERMNELFGTSVSVVSVIDEQLEKQAAEAQAEQDAMRGGDDNDSD